MSNLPFIRQTTTDVKLLERIKVERLRYVIDESRISILASVICAVIIFIAYYPVRNNSFLYSWFLGFLLVNFYRYFSALIFKAGNRVNSYSRAWYIIFMVGTILAGLGWGITGVLLFPKGDEHQKVLLILVLAGVTAGSTSSLSAVIESAVYFLILSIIPFIIIILLSNVFVYLLYDITLLAYLLYLIVLSIQTYHRIGYIFLLKYEKNSLLKALTKSNRKLKKIASHDFLTGLANTMLFESKLVMAIERAKRHEKKLAVIFIDVDNFKKINDTFGHNIGDEFLLKTAQKLKMSLRQTDTLARIGGDEFAIILEDFDDQENIVRLTRKLGDLMSQSIEIKGEVIKLSISMGISIYPIDGKDPAQLINLADSAMYKIKNQGGNGFQFN